MKIVCIDNYNRDYIDDILVAENVTESFSERIVTLLNKNQSYSDEWFISVSDDYQLKKAKPQ